MEAPGIDIVVINDDPTQITILRGLLEKAGYSARSFSDAEMAILAMSSKAPDLIITDIYMPGMDGWSFCRLLRSPLYPSFNHVPIMVVSATFAGEEADRITRNLGANAFMSAPVHGSRFLLCVKDLLSGHIPQAISRVVIAEDDKSLACNLVAVFRKYGYHAESVETGQSALRIIQDDCPEIMIVNYHMPDIEGHDLLGKINALEPHPTVVVMTDDLDPNLPLKATKLGARAYVRKPLDPEYLITICNHVRREQSLIQVEALLEKRTQELRESERQYRGIFENSVLGIYRTTANGTFIAANPACARILGYESPDDMKITVYDIGLQVFTDPGDRPRLMAILKERDVVEGYETQARRKNGDLIWVSINVRRVLTKDGVIHEGVVQDIGERRQIEEERLKLSKLETTGILAGGIAHDFNNLLATMVGNIEMAKSYVPSGKEITAHLEAAEQMAWAARRLTQQLITFAKGGTPVKRPVCLPDILKDQVPIALQGSSCSSSFSFIDGLWYPIADESQLIQIIRNIILNAREAMPDGGLVSITAENLTIQDDTVIALPKGDYVKISISDEGPGIPKDILSKIFDPYFSTKQRGTQKGMGLGLTICEAIIRKHGGSISIVQKPDNGATFLIVLPASRLTIQEERIATKLTQGVERILVMDNDEITRNLFGTALRLSGYNVELSKDGETALELYKEGLAAGHAFAAVILNLTIRGHMGGRDTLLAMRAVNSEVKAIITSGYEDDTVIRNYGDFGFKGALVKPYRINELRETLTRVLKSN
ncbi:MAG: Sensor histidine kinase RcsC [Syntrophus sp. SKADARSKE-3]|nr:Sensor histidine kinase RcsC [Syntrophus sp. SKADARSKE-3]